MRGTSWVYFKKGEKQTTVAKAHVEGEKYEEILENKLGTDNKRAM